MGFALLDKLPSLNTVTDSISSGIQKTKDYATASGTKLLSEAFSSFNKSGISAAVSQISAASALVNAKTGMTLEKFEVEPGSSLPASDLQLTETARTQELKVMMWPTPQLSPIAADDLVILEVMPSISEARSIQYKSFSPHHHPGEIMKYDTTSSRSWNITGKLIARNVSEATNNLRIINNIRAWSMPFYGQGTANSDLGKYLGAPPPIITLKAYGEKMIGPVKCVLEQYSWDFPNDVDYLQAYSTDADGKTTLVPFPVILTITVNLKETWSPAEFSGFNLQEFKNGQLDKAFNPFSAKSDGLSQVAADNQTATVDDGYTALENARFAAIDLSKSNQFATNAQSVLDVSTRAKAATKDAFDAASINAQSAARVLRQGF